MADPLVIQFAADTSRAQSAMTSLASSIAGNMASASVALSGMASNSNNAGNALGALQQNVQRAANVISNDVRNIASRTAAAATAERATLEGVVRAFTASAAGSQTANATIQAGVTGTSTAITTLAAQIPTLRTLLGAFLAFEAAKLIFETVAASIDLARKHVEEFVKIGKDAARAGVGVEFFQRATLGAETYGLTVEQATQALNRFRDASNVQIGEGKGGRNTSAVSDRLQQNVLAKNISPADKQVYDAADGAEAKFRALLDIIQKLQESGKSLAAYDLAGKFIGPDFERKLRSGEDAVAKLKATINTTSTTVAGIRIVGEEEVERARQLDEKAKDIANTFSSALAPIQKDISNSALDTYEAFLNVERTIARVVAVAAKLYTEISRIAEKAANMIPSQGALATNLGAPAIGKYLGVDQVGPKAKEIADNFLRSMGFKPALDAPEPYGPPAPLTFTVPSRGAPKKESSNTLPSLGGASRSGRGETENLDAVETLINQLEKSRDTAKAELDNVTKTNVERERAVALAKAEAAAREDVKRGKRTDPSLDDDERSRVLDAADKTARYKDAQKDLEQQIRQTADAARYLGDAAANGLADAILEGKSFNDVLNSISKQIFRSGLQALFTGQGFAAGILGTAPKASSGDTVGGIAGLLTAAFRANGGPVEAGRGYTVGERGRELFIPNQNGQIVPITRGSGMGGPQSISMGNTYLTMTPADGVTPSQLQAVLAARDAENRRTIGQQLANWRENN